MQHHLILETREDQLEAGALFGNVDLKGWSEQWFRTEWRRHLLSWRRTISPKSEQTVERPSQRRQTESVLDVFSPVGHAVLVSEAGRVRITLWVGSMVHFIFGKHTRCGRKWAAQCFLQWTFVDDDRTQVFSLVFFWDSTTDILVCKSRKTTGVTLTTATVHVGPQVFHEPGSTWNWSSWSGRGRRWWNPVFCVNESKCLNLVSRRSSQRGIFYLQLVRWYHSVLYSMWTHGGPETTDGSVKPCTPTCRTPSFRVRH